MLTLHTGPAVPSIPHYHLQPCTMRQDVWLQLAASHPAMQPAETQTSSQTLDPTPAAACRDICNCSSENCQRKSKGLRSTGQLANEAHKQGFTSVGLT